MDMAAIALQGLQQADLQLNQAAATIAAAGGLVVWFQPRRREPERGTRGPALGKE